MKTTKKIIPIFLILMLFTSTTTFTYADVSDTIAFQGNDACVDFSSADYTHIKQIVSGNIKPVNEDPSTELDVVLSEYVSDNSVFNETGSMEKLNTATSPKLVDTRVIAKDVVKISESNDSYLATIIAKNRYSFQDSDALNKTSTHLSRSDTDVCCDVYFSLSVKYDKVRMSDYQDAIKVVSFTGMVTKKTDPQMTCKKFQLKYSAYGRFVDSSRKYTRTVLPTSPIKKSKNVTSPDIGTAYTMTTGQADYTVINPGVAAVRMYYTVKRMPSSYTKDGWIGITFGSFPSGSDFI